MDLKKYIVTTGGKEKDSQIRLAKETAEKLGIAYIPRGKLSLEDLREKTGADNILVARSGQLLIETPEGEMFFHPSMAHLRIKNIRQGKGDHL
ncbi:MAG: protein-L-IsoD(D-D) O-methyltransferase, partial [Schwartzia sp.]|nr:protein-L-IsoD(D-D) O-methyltransferase [Schwartzia sp. (in: firmicutes)]